MSNFNRNIDKNNILTLNVEGSTNIQPRFWSLGVKDLKRKKFCQTGDYHDTSMLPIDKRRL